jgi:Porin subfamily
MQSRWQDVKCRQTRCYGLSGCEPVSRTGVWLVTVVLLMLSLLPVGVATAAPQRRLFSAPAPAFVKTCTISAPDQVPLFPDTAAAPEKESGSDDDDAEEEADDEDEDEEIVPGLVIPGSNTCLSIAGTLNFGVQRDWYKASATTKSTGLVPPGAISFLPSATFRLETGQTLASGLYIGTVFEFQMSPVAGQETQPVLNEASVAVGPYVFGVAASRFDFWTGDNFNFSARLPNRTVAILGYERALTSTMQVSLSLEDSLAQPGTTIATTPTSRRVPDAVARLVYGGENLTIHAAVALRDVPPTATASAGLGRAAIIGATWDGELFGKGTTLTAQFAHAVGAAAYIGSQLDQRVVASVLLGDDLTRGWSGVIALGREWTDEWSSNLYVSRYALSVPLPGTQKGKIAIDRISANLVWQPIAGFKTGLEASVAWQKIDIVGRAVPVGLAGRLASVQLFLERSF